jgi:hypothetical protein
MDISTKKLSVIVFSKDRPLQLQAYLESLIYFSKQTDLDITVLYKPNPEISYTALTNQFADIKWIEESSFYGDLMTHINKASEFLMFGCDDVIFKDFFTFFDALNVLANNTDIFGFSLRLGENILYLPQNVQKFDSHLEWSWMDTDATNWNYPWELDCTIYRKQDVLEVISKLNPDRVKNPNYLESDVANDLKTFVTKPELACFKKGKCIVLTVNRVQDDFVNGFDETLDTDVQSLNELYKRGIKIDFIQISKKKSNKIHVGVEYFLLTGKNKPYSTLTMYLKIFFIKAIGVIKRNLK